MNVPNSSSEILGGGGGFRSIIEVAERRKEALMCEINTLEKTERLLATMRMLEAGNNEDLAAVLARRT